MARTLSELGVAFVWHMQGVPGMLLPAGVLSGLVLTALDAAGVSEAGLELTESSESCRLTAYQDCAGVWTIGYGHTGAGVVPGMKVTQDQADALLLHDLDAAVAFVNRHVQVPLTQSQFDALVDFAFNAGCAALLTSTLLRKLNARDYAGAAAEFGNWVHAGGRVEPGLITRRADEAALFRKA